jgi:assimilatory nitrate reductase catalytic subunit
VVLPVVQWAEEEGTMTNLEGRVLLRQRATVPPEGVWSDAQILSGLAQRLGCGEKFPSEPRVIFEELRRASAGGVADYAGITYERIAAENGVFWPCPDELHPGTRRMFLDRFATDDGRARFHATPYREAAEEPDTSFPLYLTTGRVMQHYQSGTQTRRVKALRDAVPRSFVEIHPALAHTHDIEEGDNVRLTTRRGEAQVEARVVNSIRPDTLFVPFHWGGEGCANLLTNPALDPTSKMPEYKICAVKIEKVLLESTT